MLKWIVNFFNSIGSVISSIISLIVNIFNAVISLITHLPSYLNYMALVFNLLPPFVLSFFLIIVSVGVVYWLQRRTP